MLLIFNIIFDYINIINNKHNTVESAYCGHRLIRASAYCGQTGLVPIQMYINNVKSNRVIWALDSVYVGNFILS